MTASEAPGSLPEVFESFGSRATTSLFERRFYAGDLAYLPEPLVKALIQPLPDVVVRPVTAEEVSRVLAYAAANRIPVTPRAGGSTAYGNAVPARAGILLDMSSFRGWGEVDEAKGTVWSAPGATWFELDEALGRAGHAVCSYPSSARVATVGGWFSMGGLGIGSLRYGPLEGLVETLEVVLPSGEVRRLTRDTSPPLTWFAGAEGTLGAVTGLELRVRKRPEAEEHLLVECPDTASAVRLAETLIERLGPLVFNAHVNGAEYNRLMAELGYHGHPRGRPSLGVDLDGEPEALAGCSEEVARAAEASGSVVLDRATALEEWGSRFSSLRIKRAGPSLLGAEVLMPLARFGEFAGRCARLARQQSTAIASYGHVVERGRILAMSLVPTDESRSLTYVLDASLLNRIYDIGTQLGGVPYAVGLWNTPYVRRLGDVATLRERRERKRLLDPRGVMNPGKLYAPPLALQPWFFELGMRSLAAIRKRVAGREKR